MDRCKASLGDARGFPTTWAATFSANTSSQPLGTLLFSMWVPDSEDHLFSSFLESTSSICLVYATEFYLTFGDIGVLVTSWKRPGKPKIKY